MFLTNKLCYCQIQIQIKLWSCQYIFSDYGLHKSLSKINPKDVQPKKTQTEFEYIHHAECILNEKKGPVYELYWMGMLFFKFSFK